MLYCTDVMHCGAVCDWADSDNGY